MMTEVNEALCLELLSRGMQDSRRAEACRMTFLLCEWLLTNLSVTAYS